MDPRKYKFGPEILSERSRSVMAPRIGQNDPKADLTVNGIGLDGSGQVYATLPQ